MKITPKVILLILLIPMLTAEGQVLLSSAPFSTATPFLEPDGRREVLKISDNEFVVLSKIKGGLNSDSEYLLEKYDTNLKNYYKLPFPILINEDIKHIEFNGTDIVVFTIIHNVEASESKLKAYGFNPETGAKKWDKLLSQFKVGPFQNLKYRGAVEETFENAIASGLSKNYMVPFQYQYNIQFSPDGNKFVAYIFDYSKPNMIAQATVFDKNLNRLNDGIVPIDNNFINYGLYINNRGDIYILNVDRLGRMVVIQYNLGTKDNKLLDIQYASTHRESLKLTIMNDDEVYVGNINTSSGKLVGVMYSKFNFKENLVEKINFHDMSDGLVQTVNVSRQGNKSFKGDDNWMHYEMTEFLVNKYEKVVMVLEKREISAPEYLYEASGILTLDKWKERIAKVNAEGVVMFSFNSNDEVMWENFYLKTQSADLSTGLTSASFVFDHTDESLRMIYASSDNAAGIFNKINYVEWDVTNGNKVKDLPLQNDEGLSLVRNYTVWCGEKVVIVGKKGLLGKKYIINSYKLSAGN